MYETPLRAAHQRVIDRLLDHRSAAARRAETIRGEDEARSSLTAGRAVETVPWGVVEEAATPACELVLDYGELEGEYAALRRGVGMMDRVDRAILEIRGSDAVDLLDRLVTNGIERSETAVVAAFLLDRKGRVQADLLIVRLETGLLVEVDRTDAAAVAERIESVIFAEDCEVVDRSSERHRIDLFGPDARATIEHLAGVHLLADRATPGMVDGIEVLLHPLDQAGGGDLDVPGVAIIAATDRIEEVWQAVVDRPAPGRRPVRPIGWNAFNIARIEAGTPMFHLDFGPDATPHETGLVPRRVDFRKGCYPGQEVVARLESRAGGKGRRSVVGLRVEAEGLPVAGGQVFDRDAGIAEQVGVVTSSTVSPMRGAVPIAFATVRASHMASGTPVLVNAEGESVPGRVTGLDFLTPAEDGGTEGGGDS